MNRINFLDLKAQYAQIKNEVLPAIEKVCEQTAFSDGPFVQAFEKNFAAYCEAKYCMGVNNGTTALHLAMLALGVGAGDEVIVPANTFIATAWGPTHAGATPVFVDCDEHNWGIDATKIEAAITSKTKAVIGVHLYGQPFDVDAVKAICENHKLYLVEDAAQAQGARYKNHRVGGLTDIACFSFYPGKNLGAYGEAGGITTCNEEYDRHIRSLRSHGSTIRYYHDEVGYNMRMGGIEGAVLDIKLKYLDSWNNRRKEIAGRYRDEIKNPQVKMQHMPQWSDGVYHLFVITVPDREAMIQHLNKNEIYPGLHYPVPCHLQKAYAHLNYKQGDFPNAEYLATHCLSLPIYAELNDDDVSRVIESINAYNHG